MIFRKIIFIIIFISLINFSYSALPADLFTGLMSYYPLNSGYHLNSTVGSSQTLAEGSTGVTQNLDYVNISTASNSYLQLASNPTPYAGPARTYNWTVSMWFNPDSLSLSFQCIFRQEGNATYRPHTPIIDYTGDKFCLLPFNDNVKTVCTQPVTGVGTWHHYMIMHEYLNYTHSNWTLILDNQRYSALSTNQSFPTGYVIFGAYSTGSSFNFGGGMRDIGIWNRTLSSAEISWLYGNNGSYHFISTPSQSLTVNSIFPSMNIFSFLFLFLLLFVHFLFRKK